MIRFLAQRLGFGALVLLTLSSFVFFLFFVAPGDPARVIAGDKATEQQLEQIRANLGVDRPVIQQYGSFLARAAQGDLGYSYRNRQPVAQIILRRVPATVSLVAGAVVLWLAIGIPIGLMSARAPGSLRDRLGQAFILVGLSFPTFVLGMMALYTLYFLPKQAGFTLFPAGGYKPLTGGVLVWAWHLALPWTTLALVMAALYARLTRGQMLEVRSGRELVLSAGAIGSPHILQLSGVGPASLLKRHGIEVVHDLPGVGENLQDHLQIRAVFKVNNARTLNMLANSLSGKARIALEYALKRSGPMSMSPSQLGAFSRSDEGQPHANLEFHVQPLSLDAFGEPLHRIPAITASVCNLNPTSVGTMRLRSASAQDAPAIAPNYLSTEEDRRIAAESLRQVRKIVSQPALAKYQPVEWKPGPQFQSDEELARLAGDIASTIFHPVGTTKMGRDDDAMAVVDSRLRVRGIAGLRVVDAGIMPKITSGNTNAPTLMIAEKAAGWIMGEARQP